jgi:HAE1 family hydrophobic/amphiphilic exporter-1
MSLADVSIKRPTFITCIIILMLAVGLISMRRLGVDLFPDVTFPVIFVNTPYPGAGSRPLGSLNSSA